MNTPLTTDMIQQVLRQLPKRAMPADLRSSIEAQTVLRKPWYETDLFRLRWLPALVGLATACGALWLSKLQTHPDRKPPSPVAIRPAPAEATQHAFLPFNQPSNLEKGESREHPKS